MKIEVYGLPGMVTEAFYLNVCQAVERLNIPDCECQMITDPELRMLNGPAKYPLLKVDKRKLSGGKLLTSAKVEEMLSFYISNANANWDDDDDDEVDMRISPWLVIPVAILVLVAGFLLITRFFS